MRASVSAIFFKFALRCRGVDINLPQFAWCASFEIQTPPGLGHAPRGALRCVTSIAKISVFVDDMIADGMPIRNSILSFPATRRRCVLAIAPHVYARAPPQSYHTGDSRPHAIAGVFLTMRPHDVGRISGIERAFSRKVLNAHVCVPVGDPSTGGL